MDRQYRNAILKSLNYNQGDLIFIPAADILALITNDIYFLALARPTELLPKS